MTPWIYLALAAVFEVVFAFTMKASKGFTVLAPSVATAIAATGGIVFLTLALKTLPVSLAYPLWVAAGMIGSVLLGAWFFGESLTAIKVLCVGLILLGVIGLKLTSA